MPSIMLNGVIWSKAEKDILKAGVSKYGENQWDRIIHLLPGKTVEQCKELWEFGPKKNIKKTKWTRDEDDDLLHLVTVVAVKWQDIASILRRTAVDCYKRHVYLTNRAQKIREEREAALERRKLLPRRIPRITGIPGVNQQDTQNDLEMMLSEARKKLANSQAKSARLIAREKRLEVTRRFANLRRQREHMRAKMRAEELFRGAQNSRSAHSTNYHFDWCHYHCSTNSRLQEVNEPAENEEEIKRLVKEHEDFIDKLLNNGEPSSKRNKVIVIEQPEFAYHELQQVVEREMFFESTRRHSEENCAESS